MGIIRVILALSVVLNHLPTHYNMIGGQSAVQLFYIISGFLISYILAEDGRYKTLRFFYVSRFLRLYPIYILVACLTLIFYIFFNPSFFELYNSIPMAAKYLLATTNLVLFGQDQVMFMAVRDEAIIYAVNFRDTDYNLWTGLLVPQAWTLGVEISFYLIAPFIIRSKYTIAIIILLSLAVRIYLDEIGIGDQDPWSYRFFPKELLWFLLGAVSHQILAPAYRFFLSNDNLQRLSFYCTWGMIFFILFYRFLPVEIANRQILFVSFTFFVPLFFLYQKSRRIDKNIGELSYPIYIIHLLVIKIFELFYDADETYSMTALVAILFFIILFSHLLNISVATRVEALRMRFKDQSMSGVRVRPFRRIRMLPFR